MSRKDFITDIPDGRRYDQINLPDGGGVIIKPDGSATFSRVDGLSHTVNFHWVAEVKLSIPWTVTMFRKPWWLSTL